LYPPEEAALSGEGLDMEYEQSICAVCGLVGDFCGYHHLGPKKLSLCISCAETKVDVYKITLCGESAGLIIETTAEAVDTIKVLIEEMSYGDGYSITKENLKRLLIVNLPEFSGF
jgi:hypothetical protein